MKRVLFLIIVFFVLSVTCAFASDFKILKITGEVLFRASEEKPWMAAREGDSLNEDNEILTRKKAECVLGYGKKIERVFTVKQNSQIKLDDESIERFELLTGRIFSLVEKLEEGSSFEIKTPVAIAGVRGTGWTVDAGKKNSVKCFEGEVYVKGLDEQGNVVAHQDVKNGLGVNIADSGEMAEQRKLSKKDKKEWKKFSDIVKDFIGKPIGKAVGVIGSVGDGAVDGYLGKEKENPFNR